MSERTETDDGLFGALELAEKAMVPDPDGPVSYDRAEAALLIGALRERLGAWRDSWNRSDSVEADRKADRALIAWLESQFVGEVPRRPAP